MTDQPITPASLRGAVDLSALARPASARPTFGPSSVTGESDANDNLVIAVDDATFADAMQTSAQVPVIVALWSGSRPDTKSHIDALAQEVRSYAGRMQLATVDIDVSLQIRQALQVQQVPMVLAILAGQPVPLYVGDQPADAIRQVLDKVLEAAAANGVTGRLEAAPASDEDTAEDAEPELPEIHQRAFDAIEQGDFDAATAAYEQALKDNPADDEARLGLGQVGLLKRTSGVDLNTAREAAAAAPTDVEKQTLVADLDVLGGHIEDAFARLIDLVKATVGDERNAAREHLVQLFDVVGPTDERVKKARTALMSALY
ncbi:thioredoxin [Flexivirga endophytica]|uniref:Thioredoxin n=1 Tax=Flexivirga endophytica TaxID=1849103 RepID=A0A916WNL7_9MICO|nr:tetratricopeptide repeat protein [Flexivirga endophytica]GGB15633.1 thioredoxin [Flexivirga endophytica]GHB39960.1 thioredoxin [Flexivirga endophytica]